MLFIILHTSGKDRILSLFCHVSIVKTSEGQLFTKILCYLGDFNFACSFNLHIPVMPIVYLSLNSGKLTLKIPWKNLYKEAVEATLDGLYLLAVPNSSKFHTAID